MCKQRIIRTRLGLFAAFAALALAACGDNSPGSSGGDDKAGGSGDPVVLTMANTADSFRFSPAIQYFVDRVDELSGGALRVEAHHEWGNFADDAEQQVVRAVAAGDANLAGVGTPVLDTLGVTSFRALSAPMLIDSYPLQKAVIASEVPGDMLAGLDHAGVSGIAVLADGLRKPIAVERPLLSPGDFDGITFQAYRSTTYADAIHALGASQSEAIGPHRAAGLHQPSTLVVAETVERIGVGDQCHGLGPEVDVGRYVRREVGDVEVSVAVQAGLEPVDLARRQAGGPVRPDRL